MSETQTLPTHLKYPGGDLVYVEPDYADIVWQRAVTPTTPEGCRPEHFNSQVCIHGTQGCSVKHQLKD